MTDDHGAAARVVIAAALFGERPDGTPWGGGWLNMDMVVSRLSAAGYQIVPRTPDAGGAVTVPLDDLRAALDAMVYVQDTYFWEKWNYQEPFDRLTAIAAGKGGRDDDAD